MAGLPPPPQQMRRAFSDGSRYTGSHHHESYMEPYSSFMALPHEYDKFQSGYGHPTFGDYEFPMEHETEARRRRERLYLEREIRVTQSSINHLETEQEHLNTEMFNLQLARQTTGGEIKAETQRMNQIKQTNAQMARMREAKAEERQAQRANLLRNMNVPASIREHASLKQSIDDLKNKNNVLHAMIDITEKDLNKRVEYIRSRFDNEKHVADRTEQHNQVLEQQIKDLNREKDELQSQLDAFSRSMEEARDDPSQVDSSFYSRSRDRVGLETAVNAQSRIGNMRMMEEKRQEETVVSNDVTKKKTSKYSDYPPEGTVISNLLLAQVEFYFSDYNLKRDKRLLEDVVKGGGFLRIDKVLGFARVRQLCSDPMTLLDALRRSTLLMIKENEEEEKEKEREEEVKETKMDEDHEDVNNGDSNARRMLVGRNNFEPPVEKEYPFRRTVFLFGIELHATKEEIIGMLEPFGVVSKLVIDDGPDCLDRKVAMKFFEKARAYTVFAQRSREAMQFKSGKDGDTDDDEKDENEEDLSLQTVSCEICKKHKPVTEGYYKGGGEIMCSQCAAGQAESQITTYHKNNSSDARFYLGNVPLKMDLMNTKTALVVFSSQRQASKCAYIRARIAHNGMFATHYHHYSKLRRELGAEEGHDGNRKERNDGNREGRRSSVNNPGKGVRSSGRSNRRRLGKNQTTTENTSGRKSLRRGRPREFRQQLRPKTS